MYGSNNNFPHQSPKEKSQTQVNKLCFSWPASYGPCLYKCAEDNSLPLMEVSLGA